MKIRIIKNDPPKNTCEVTDISKYIGSIFYARKNIENDNIVVVAEGCDLNGCIIFKGEYEHVDDDTKVSYQNKTIRVDGKWYSEEELIEFIEKANMYDSLCH